MPTRAAASSALRTRSTASIAASGTGRNERTSTRAANPRMNSGMTGGSFPPVSPAARAMRRILIDASRRRNADKRGNGMESLTLDPDLAMQAQDLDLFALDQALAQLAVAEPRMAQVVQLHFYAGLEFVAIAQMMELSERTVARDWRTARALLLQSLGDIAAAQP